MTQHHHEHPETHAHEPDKYRGLHKDWRAWTVVLLMLAGMVAYILSLNEADNPNNKGGREVPAAAG